MFSSRSLRFFPLVLAAVLPVFGGTPLVDLASDNAAMVLAIHDAPSLVSQWQLSPWAKTWNDEQMKRYLAPLRAKWKVDEWSTMSKDKTGFTIDELLGLATGDAILIVPDFEFAKETPAKTPPLLIAVEIGGNASKVEALLARTSKDEHAREETSDFSGVVVHMIHPEAKGGKEVDPTAWAITDGVWLISPSKDAVLSGIDAVKKGGVENSWGKSERFVRLQQHTGDSHFTFNLNIEAIYPVLTSAIAAKAKTNPQQASGPFGIDSQALLGALGLDAFRDFYFSMKLGDASTEFRGGLTYTAARGLVKLLAYHDGPPETPAFVSAKWVSVSTSKFSVKEMYAAIEEILENFNPAISGMFQGQLRTVNKQLGIDLKRDFIGSLGDTAIVAYAVSPNALPESPIAADVEQLFALSLENQDVFTNALEAVKRSLGPQGDSFFVSRDYLGQKIYTFKAPGGPQAKAVSYAIAKGYFLISVGSTSAIETALQGLAGSQPTLWDKPEVRTAFAELPPTASAFHYQDVQVLVRTVVEGLSRAGAMMKSSAPKPVPDASKSGSEAPTQITAAENALPIDSSAPPDAATIAKYWSHGWGYTTRDSSGLHGVSQIVYPK